MWTWFIVPVWCRRKGGRATQRVPAPAVRSGRVHSRVAYPEQHDDGVGQTLRQLLALVVLSTKSSDGNEMSQQRRMRAADWRRGKLTMLWHDDVILVVMHPFHVVRLAGALGSSSL
jgi:hypothetical protein